MNPRASSLRESLASDLPESPELPEREEVSHRHGHGRRARIIRRARLWLVMMFISFRVVDALALVTYFGVHSSASKGRVLGGILSTGVWTTVLLVCIWKRQMWARYMLTTILMIEVIGTAVSVPEFAGMLPVPAQIRVVCMVLLHFLAAWGLISLPSIRRYFSVGIY
jgi:hypothetical protein